MKVIKKPNLHEAAHLKDCFSTCFCSSYFDVVKFLFLFLRFIFYFVRVRSPFRIVGLRACNGSFVQFLVNILSKTYIGHLEGFILNFQHCEKFYYTLVDLKTMKILAFLFQNHPT